MGERWTLTYETTGNWSVEDSNRLEQMARRVGMCPRDLIKLILNQYSLRCESLSALSGPVVTRMVREEKTSLLATFLQWTIITGVLTIICGALYLSYTS